MTLGIAFGSLLHEVQAQIFPTDDPYLVEVIAPIESETLDEAVRQSSVIAEQAAQAAVAVLLDGAPTAVDTFLEAYQRFVANEGVAAALNQLLSDTRAALAAHAVDLDNPHGVTKAQVGLGNVQNFAPADLPVSTAAQEALAQRQPLDPDLTAIASLATSLLGRTLLTVTTLDAGMVGSGTFDIARIPVIPSQKQVVSSGGIANLNAAQQSDIGKGTVVTTADGGRYVFTGAGSKIDATSYIQLADITPTIAAVEGLQTALDGKVSNTATAAIALLELAYPSIPATRPAGAGKLWLNDGVPQFTTTT